MSEKELKQLSREAQKCLDFLKVFFIIAKRWRDDIGG
jgi:hypothetical protein